MHEYEVTSLALYCERSTSHNSVVVAVYRAYSLMFWHTGHLAALAYTAMSSTGTLNRKEQENSPHCVTMTSQG